MKLLKPTLFLFLFLCYGGINRAQTSPDAGLWTTATLEHSLNKKWGMFINEEIRLRDNFNALDLFYTTIGMEYKMDKYFKTSLAYRPTQKLVPGNIFSFRNRLQWDFSIKTNPGKFDFCYRHRLQADLKNVYSSDKGHLPEWFSRNKFQVKYNLDKSYAPYLSVELRYQILDPGSRESDYAWHRARYQAGIDYKIYPHHTFGLYYMIQNEFNVANPEALYIIGLEYTYKL